MAQFRYLGRTKKAYESVLAPTIGFRFHRKDGKTDVIEAPVLSVGFVKDEILPYETDDPHLIRHMKADPRFEVIE